MCTHSHAYILAHILAHILTHAFKGTISAVGGNGDSLGGGGSGGRIVLHATKTALLSFSGGTSRDSYATTFPKSHVHAHGGLAAGGATSIDGTWSFTTTATSNIAMTFTCVNCCTRTVCASYNSRGQCTRNKNEAYTCDQSFTAATIQHNSIDIDTATNPGRCRRTYLLPRLPLECARSLFECCAFQAFYFKKVDCRTLFLSLATHPRACLLLSTVC